MGVGTVLNIVCGILEAQPTLAKCKVMLGRNVSLYYKCTASGGEEI